MEILNHTQFSAKERKRSLSAIRYAWVHRSEVAQTGSETAQWHLAHPSYTGGKLPYHIYIQKDGTVEQLVPLTRIAAGVVGGNKTGIQIALCGDFRKSAPTPEQAVSLRKIMADLISWNGDLEIWGHTELPGMSNNPNKICPGKRLNMDGVRELAKKDYTPWGEHGTEKLQKKGWIL